MKAFWMVVALASCAAALASPPAQASLSGPVHLPQAAKHAPALPSATASTVEATAPSTTRRDRTYGEPSALDLETSDRTHAHGAQVTARNESGAMSRAAAQSSSSGCSAAANAHNDLLTGLLIALGCALFSALLRRLPNS